MEIGKYYLRDGSVTTDIRQWVKQFDENKTVAQTTLPDGKWVSTVYLGLDHSFGDGPPMIFETMVFPKHGDWGELDCMRYSTEAEALAGHADMVAKWELTDEVAREAFDELGI